MKTNVMRSVALLTLAGALGIGTVGCSSGSGSADGAAADGSSSVSELAAVPVEDSVIIDVRTPEEFAEGHLDGATNLDLNGGQFQEAITTLDPGANYLIYCRSGNRSGQATALLRDAGFENVVDLGSMEAASSETGVQIVR